MDTQYRMPIFRFHFDKTFIAQDAGVVDEDIHRAKGIQGRLDDGFTAVRRRHIVVIGHGFAAGSLDFAHHLVGRRSGSVAGPVPGPAQVVNHHLGAPFGQFQGVSTPQAGTGTGDDGHPAVIPDFTLGNRAVFENTVVDNDLVVIGIDHPPEGLAVIGLPDQGFDRHPRVEGFGKTARHAPRHLWFAGYQRIHQGPAGEAMGAEPMHDRFFKAGHFGKFRIDMQAEDITGKPVDQGLVR